MVQGFEQYAVLTPILYLPWKAQALRFQALSSGARLWPSTLQAPKPPPSPVMSTMFRRGKGGGININRPHPT